MAIDPKTKYVVSVLFGSVVFWWIYLPFLCMKSLCGMLICGVEATMAMVSEVKQKRR